MRIVTVYVETPEQESTYWDKLEALGIRTASVKLNAPGTQSMLLPAVQTTQTLFEGADNVSHVFDYLEKEKAITEEQDD